MNESIKSAEVTANELAATAAEEAKELAAAFNAVLSPDSSACAWQHEGSWYVVTSGTGEGCDFAYDVDDLLLSDFVDDDGEPLKDFDYSAWCADSSGPVADHDLAIAYYIEHDGTLLGEAGVCNAIVFTRPNGGMMTMEERNLVERTLKSVMRAVS